MADELQDNTTAQEKGTEAQQAATKAAEDLARVIQDATERARQALAQANASTPPLAALPAPPPPLPPAPPPPALPGAAVGLSQLEAKYQAEHRRVYGQQTPPPPPTSAPAMPANYHGVARHATPEEVAAHEAQYKAQKQAQPPPLSTPAALLRHMVEQAQKEMQELGELYRANPTMKPDALAARGMRETANAQNGLIGKQFAGLRPEERQAALPAMQALEQQRKQVEEEEIRRRQGLNKELGHGTSAMMAFARGAAGGNPMGGAIAGIGTMGAVGGVIAAAIGMAMGKVQEHQAEIQQGGADLSPSGAQTERVSIQLRRMEEARQAGEPSRQVTRAMMEQRQTQAMSLGMNRWQNPRSLVAAAMPFSTGWNVERSAVAAYAAQLSRSGNVTSAESARLRVEIDHFEKWIREHSQAPKPFKEDIVNPGSSGYTTNLAYHDELQMGSLQRQDASNERDQQVIQMMREQGVLLERLVNNTNGLENLQPAFQ